MEDELAAAAGGIDLLLEGSKADAPLLKQRDGVDEVSEGAVQPVEPPDDEGVSRPGEVERLSQSRPLK